MVEFLRILCIIAVPWIIVSFMWTIIHELSHWLVARIMGIKITRIRVLPHISDGGRFVLGSAYKIVSLGICINLL